MKKILLLLIISLSAACSNTATITHTWMAEDLADKDLDGVLVLAISKKPESRQKFEREFTDALKKHGVRAVASYEHKGGARIDKEDVLAISRELNLDAVLVTTFAGRDQHEVLHAGRTYYAVVPIYNRGGYYGRGTVYGAPMEVGHVPDFYAQHKSLHLEANLYEIATEEHLWVAAAGIDETNDIDEMRRAFIQAYMKLLSEQKMVR
jgi:hypothetical protein